MIITETGLYLWNSQGGLFSCWQSQIPYLPPPSSISLLPSGHFQQTSTANSIHIISPFQDQLFLFCFVCFWWDDLYPTGLVPASWLWLFSFNVFHAVCRQLSFFSFPQVIFCWIACLKEGLFCEVYIQGYFFFSGI